MTLYLARRQQSAVGGMNAAPNSCGKTADRPVCIPDASSSVQVLSACGRRFASRSWSGEKVQTYRAIFVDGQLAASVTGRNQVACVLQCGVLQSSVLRMAEGCVFGREAGVNGEFEASLK